MTRKIAWAVIVSAAARARRYQCNRVHPQAPGKMAQQNNLFALLTLAELLESLQQHTQCLQLTSEVQLSSDEGRKEASVVSCPRRISYAPLTF